MRKVSLDRRKYFCLLAASMAGVYAAPVLQVSAGGANVATILKSFLDECFVPTSLQCGARTGDGVPKFAKVEAFSAWISSIKAPETQLGPALNAARTADLQAGRTLVIDGWVLARTEALAASVYVLMAHVDCRLPKTAGD